MIFEKQIGELPVKVKVYYDDHARLIKIEFSREFYVHKEVVDAINYYLEKGVLGKKATDLVLHDIADWISNYLRLAFKLNIAQLNAFTGCITINGVN